MSDALRILLIDDNPDDRALVARELEREFSGVQVVQAKDEASLELALAEGRFDAAITDFQLRWSDGLQVLRRLKKTDPLQPVIMFTATGSEELAVQAMKEGLDDYVLKSPKHLQRLSAALRLALERRHERGELKTLEERYRVLFESVPSGLVRCTPDGRILAANPALVEMLGCPDRDTLLRTPADKFWAVASEHQRFLDDMQQHGVVRQREVEVRRYDGRLAWVHFSARSVFDSRGKFLYYEGAVEDITERLALLEQLRHAQKMEAIGRLAGGVAHDFNNLLTVINGYSTLVLNTLGASHPAHADLKQVLEAGEKAMALTRQLLAFSRRQVLEPRAVDLRTVVAGVERMLRRVIPENITIETQAGTGGGTILADPAQIEQVIMNLALNARDAMPEGGTLTIEIKDVQVDEGMAARLPGLRPGGHVCLSVTDSGHGMDREVLAHLFEPFFTTKPKGQGTGLGLATAYGIVQQSGGHIGVESQLGRGSTFSVYLPQAEGEAIEPRPRPEAADDYGSGSETVLVVEDEEAVRTLVQQVLRQHGYRILAAGDAKSARRLSKDHRGPIHLLLTDVVMPKTSGRELAMRLTRERPDMRVLYMSGYDEGAVTRQGVVDPGAALVKKPFTPEILALRVRQALDRRPPT